MLLLIKKYAPEGAFTADEVAILAEAFDDAWRRFEASGTRFGSDRAKEQARQDLGRSIIEIARRGILDPRRLAEDGLLHMAQARRRNAPDTT